LIRNGRRAAALAVVAVLALPCVGHAQSADDLVVPPGQTFGGRTYAMWQTSLWKTYLQHSRRFGSCPRPDEIHASLMFVLGALASSSAERCSVPTGRAIYIQGAAQLCTTLDGPSARRRTDAQLLACAQRGWERSHPSDPVFDIDGQSSSNPGAYVVATRVFKFRLPRLNHDPVIFHARRRSGRAAAYGAGYIIKSLSPGLHTIRVSQSEQVIVNYDLDLQAGTPPS
jgi:hypothetical protein